MSRETAIAEAFIAACRDELEAPKPGNVHVLADGHSMTVADFICSAEVAAPSIARHGTRVGARILGAVEATRAAVGQNTNLGILLLCAPLACAVEFAPADLRTALAKVLSCLDQQDAALAFRAIALAAPGGLGRAPRHDVSEPATVTLREAMAEAAHRDRIARQYATTYDDVFDLGVPVLDDVLQRGASRWAATLAVHLGFLAAFPDSHILRKYGEAQARAVQAEATPLKTRLLAGAEAALMRDLLAFDARLKARRLNPGTSADLTVATLFVRRLRESLPCDRNNG
ncbi:MAG: triphosphoribosyl-dephospho-CoA synthase [Methylobacteriaceae bacterium]|nr:triphosphoribosyl-dephospho-CoA synthase [Methylobacteriaceae bacterium]